MAEFYRHTDEDGAWIEGHSREDGDLLFVIWRHDGLAHAVDVPEVDGRRLLAALQRHYAHLDGAAEQSEGSGRDA